jgi:GIY-YIG catalytic domain
VASTGWQFVGTITVVNGVPVLPKFPFPLDVPGVYRLRFLNGYVYVGETKNLRARFDNYINPTSGTEQEHVIRHIFGCTPILGLRSVNSTKRIPAGWVGWETRRDSAGQEEQAPGSR